MVALIEMKSFSLRDPPRVVDEVDRQQLDRPVVVQPVVEALGPEAERRLDLVAPQPLVDAGDRAAIDEIDDAVGQQLGVDAEVAVVAQRLEHGVGDPADADLQRRPVGDVLDDGGRDRPVAVVRLRGRHLHQRPVRLAPAQQLGRVDLVEPERPRHPRVDLEEERHAPDQRGHVVRVGAEREVPVAIRRAGGGQHERPRQAVDAAAAASRRSGSAPDRSGPPRTPAASPPTGSTTRGAAGRRRRRGCTAARAARASGARARRRARRRAPRARRAGRPARRWRAAG